jgi:outer membrane lipoprotein-sorting protein
MKKIIVLLTALATVGIINSQSLDAIVKQYSSAINSDKLASIKTIKITGKMSAMGMEMPMVMYMKNPNKIKVTYSFNGQDMVSVFDGVKGYAMNPMMGSAEPVELTGEQLKQVQNNNAFKNELLNYYNNKQVTLEGTEDVNGSPANKLKITPESGNPIFMYLDKKTGLIIKTSTKIEQMGNTMNVDSYMTDYIDTKGVIMPKKTKAMANGMEAATITFDTIEVDVPMDDSLFKIK